LWELAPSALQWRERWMTVLALQELWELTYGAI
jgi:hypothetical protein